MENEIEYFDWLEKFKPEHNKILLATHPYPERPDDCAPYNGRMYETFGEELEVVMAARKINPYKIWTLLDCGTISQGTHIVNRMGYFICEIPWSENDPDTVPEERFDVVYNSNENGSYNLTLNDEIVLENMPVDEDAALAISEHIENWVKNNGFDDSKYTVNIQHSSEEVPLGIIVDAYEGEDFIETMTIMYDYYMN